MPRHDPVSQALSLLDGRTQPTLEALVRAIREVNPTARGLSSGEQAKRYSLKTRLQESLIRTFGDELTVEQHDDDFVLLRHRETGKDACHARVAGLDDEARRWVRWQLDLAAEGESEQASAVPVTAGEPRPASPLHAIERGRLACHQHTRGASSPQRRCPPWMASRCSRGTRDQIGSADSRSHRSAA